MVSLRDVAKEAGVSVATVSHVINGTRYVSPELTERVRCALRKLNYEPNLVARGLRTRHSWVIGLITSDITNPFYPGVAQGAADYAAQHGYSLMLYDAGEDGQHEEKIVSLLQRRQTDGFLFTSIDANSPTVRRLHEQNFPFVLINRQLKDIKTHYVGIDNRAGMSQAVRHLAGLGHRVIAFVTGLARSTAAEERFEGFLEAVHECGLESGPELVYAGSYQLADGCTAAYHLIQARPDITAIVAANDLMAFGVWQCLHRLGIRVPDDVSVLGFDDIYPASMGPIGLTTVRAPQRDMGERAAELLLKVIEARRPLPARQIILPVELIVRHTTTVRRPYGQLAWSPEAMARVSEDVHHFAQQAQQGS